VTSSYSDSLFFQQSTSADSGSCSKENGQPSASILLSSNSRSQNCGGRPLGKTETFGQSLSSKFAKWSRKVQGIASCGATLSSLPSAIDDNMASMADQSAKSSLRNDPSTAGGDVPNDLAQQKIPGNVVKQNTKYNAATSSSSGSQCSNKKFHRSSMYTEEYDHHTLATATTSSATISYSTDQGDDVSEAGMEVIMSSHEQSGAMGDHLISHRSTSNQPCRLHSFPAGKHTFTVDERYSFIRTIGSGAYGVVVSSTDAVTSTNVAIKMVPKAFSDEIDAKRILREIKLLQHLQHENIVKIVDMMPPSVAYLEDYHDVYIVTDLMETDLHRIIYSKQKLSIDHVQYFIYQVLRALKYIHSCRVVHRDLKPSNLLVNSNCDLKICDFGLARGIYDDPKCGGPTIDEVDRHGTILLTEYVVTRWYRAPEIMLACHEYSYPVDVWSVGCIFAELILRKPYFPGDDYIDQVRPFLFVSPAVLRF
jgi:tRNA A-37 threonylcarbamoyl transferase component Bud32